MNFLLTEEQKTFQKAFKEFCIKEVLPYADKADEEERLPGGIWKKLGDSGYLGIHFPVEYGGQGADLITYAVGAEELSFYCASTALSANASVTLGGIPLFLYGTEEQKVKYLKRLISGEMIGAFGLTEPHCGSDVASIKTTAVKDGNKYILNGSKTFITNGPIADVVTVFAVTNKEKKHKGISAFLVEKGTAGFSSGKEFKKMGMRGSVTSELFFDNCVVDEENMLGKEGEGFIIAMKTLEYARISMACICLGIAEAALQESIKYAEQRVAFGKPIGYFQEISFKIADMKMLTETARQLIYYACWLKDKGEPANTAISIAKLFASETATKCTHWGVQIFGGYGYIREYKIERLFRDARLGEIGEGTSEIQRLIIAKDLLRD